MLTVCGYILFNNDVDSTQSLPLQNQYNIMVLSSVGKMARRSRLCHGTARFTVSYHDSRVACHDYLRAVTTS